MNNCFLQTSSQSGFDRLLQEALPRLITQLDRDPDSPTYGCFDRDFWHYKIRDFSSIVLQQGAIALQTLSSSAGCSTAYSTRLTDWVNASLMFWARQQLSSGSFNEYYPNEEGFPPTAFSLFSVVLIHQMRGFPTPDPTVAKAIQKAVDWLLTVQEKKAFNQEATALAALTLAAVIPGVSVDNSRLDSRLDVFFTSQSGEGWFPEYGGADIGYLSVTIDALFVYFELTGDRRARTAMNRALHFISSLISVCGSTPVMINSRNTDYIAPYGIIRLAEKEPVARRVVEVLFDFGSNDPHFLCGTDDRYLCHYIYQSCFRGRAYLSAMTTEKALLPCETVADIKYPEAGLYVVHSAGCRSVYTAAAKGGICYIYNRSGLFFADYGWRQRLTADRVALTHWQDSENKWSSCSDDYDHLIDTAGFVTSHVWIRSSPLRHFTLRCASLLMGRRIIAGLKKIMIFSASKTGISYRRTLRISEEKITITDIFTGREIQSFSPTPAPPYSLRHVASAANYSPEDFPFPGSAVRVMERTSEALVITSTIAVPEADK